MHRILYAASTAGFYRDDVHAAWPADAIEVSAADHALLMAGQVAGQRIVADAAGRPALADQPPPPAPPAIRRIAPLAFRRRLSAERRRALTTAASAALDGGDATIQTFMDDLAASRFVDLDDADTVAAVAALQFAGVLTAEEAVALLADGTADEAA